MKTSFDSLSRIVHIQVQVVSSGVKILTKEFDVDTVIEVTDSNDLVGIEMMNPNQRTLNRIAKKFKRPELVRINLQALQESIN